MHSPEYSPGLFACGTATATGRARPARSSVFYALLSHPAYDMWPQCPLPAFILNSNQGCRLCSAGYSIHVNINGCISLAHHIRPSPFTKASGWPAPCYLAGLATASSCCWLAHCIHAGDQRIIIDKQVVPRAVPRNGRGRLHRRILDRG